MGTDVLKSYNSLQEELDRAKNNLSTLNVNIRRIVGNRERDPKEVALRGDRKRTASDNRRSDGDRQRIRETSPPPAKRLQETKSVFSRLSAPVRERDDKPRITSRVVRELPSREDIVAAQGADAQSRARNRRMFGSLLGTLQKFCQEESRLKQKEEKKAKIEKKVEEEQIKERETLKRERQNLFLDRKRQQLEIRKLELKMNRLKEFEIWEKSKKDLKHFIRTKTKPHIYYKPKAMNEKTSKRLAECQASLKQEIEKKRAQLDEEIAEIESKFKLREGSIKDADDAPKDRSSRHDRDIIEYNDSIYENSDEENYSNSKRDKREESKIEKNQIEDNIDDTVQIKEERSSSERDRPLSSVVVTRNI